MPMYWNGRTNRAVAALLCCISSLAVATQAHAQVKEAKPPSGDAPAPVSTTRSDKRIYTPADFARFAPKTALDMLNQVPGFSIRGEDGGSRGLGQASGNILLNGERISGKSTNPVTALQAIPAGNVERIEIVDAAQVDVPGLTGQIANVFYKATAKLSGQYNYRPEFRARYADPLLTRGDVSVSGTRGPVEYTLSLRNDAFRAGAGGPTVVRRGDGALFETRDDEFKVNFDQPQASGQFKIDGPGTSVGNLNLLGRSIKFRFEETSRRDRIIGPDQLRLLGQGETGFSYEIGGDYELALVGGRLKLIGLKRYTNRPVVQSSLTTFDDENLTAVGSRFLQEGDSKELIGRAEYRWKMGRTDIQLSGEAAYNSLDRVSSLFALAPSGDYVEIFFPQGTGRVNEDRYEGLLTVGRPISRAVTVQLVVGAEQSTIVQEGAGGKERSFFRPKGSLNVAARLSPTFNANFKIIRRVGQLDFGQFLARVFLDNNNQNVGNPDLVPTQQWRFELELAKDLGAYGKTRLNLAAALFEDFVDIIPVGANGESPGNISRARAYAIELNNTFQLDPLGLTGAKINLRALTQFSAIRDPLTHEKRSLSSFTDRLVEFGYRHDIPKSDWAYGAEVNYQHVTRTFRLNEVSRQSDGPVFAGVFVEHKDVLGLTMRATAGNIVNARSRLDRVAYAGRRNVAPVEFTEIRNRRIGPIFSFSARGTF